ncbi:MAG: OmpA family protein [Verrucomicrobiota bacterium]
MAAVNKWQELTEWDLMTSTIVAFIGSLLLHLVLILWFFRVELGYGQPIVDPIEPKRFNLRQALIDPKSLESEYMPKPSFGQKPQVEPLNLEPEDIDPFGGPINAPKIPMPRLRSEIPQSLSSDIVSVPTEAFSALPLSSEGKVPQVAQALVDQASTAALAENHDLGIGNLALGSENQTLDKGLPGLGEISGLVKTQAPKLLDKPKVQPILLRLSSDVLFKFDSAQILPEGEEKLVEILELFNSAVRADVTIEGHTDTLGEDAYNQKLSQLRAQAVADWIINKAGISKNDLQVKGYGETRPIVNPDGDRDEQQLNRRVEIRIEAEK